jgi:hypothetical protein
MCSAPIVSAWRNVRRTVHRITAADIAVDTREPNLLELLSLGLAFRLLHPQRRHEVLAPLVERERMECMLDVEADARVVEAVVAAEIEHIESCEVGRDSDRTDRVPYPDHLDRHALVAATEAVEGVVALLLVGFLVAVPQFEKAVEVLLAEQSRITDQPAEAARRVGAARETEQENLVADVVFNCGRSSRSPLRGHAVAASGPMHCFRNFIFPSINLLQPLRRFVIGGIFRSIGSG